MTIKMIGGNNTVKITYREALKQAIREALQKDERVFLMGEDVGRYGGAFAVSKGLLDEFGPERIMDVPLSESGFVGAGIGAALGGIIHDLVHSQQTEVYRHYFHNRSHPIE